jgi:hypothetical protein
MCVKFCFIMLGNRYLSDIGAIKSYLVPSVYRRLRPLWCLLFYLVISYLYDIRGEVHVSLIHRILPFYISKERRKERSDGIAWSKQQKKKISALSSSPFVIFSSFRTTNLTP